MASQERLRGPVTFGTARVADVMTWGVLTCTRDTGLAAVARMMNAYRVHAIVVVGSAETAEGLRPLWGVVSDLDLVAAAEDGAFGQRTAADAAVGKAMSVVPEDSLQHACELMAHERVSHLVVVDRSTRNPVGVVSALDVASVLSG